MLEEIGYGSAGFAIKTPSKHEELHKAHEHYLGKPPSELEKFLYGWLSVAQIEAKLEEFANLEKLRASAQAKT